MEYAELVTPLVRRESFQQIGGRIGFRPRVRSSGHPNHQRSRRDRNATLSEGLNERFDVSGLKNYRITVYIQLPRSSSLHREQSVFRAVQACEGNRGNQKATSQHFALVLIMPGRRKRSARHRACIEKFLGTKCLICFTPQETPSKPLSCCGYRIHEDCLLSCFRFAVGNMRDCCPHCRSPITPHNHGQPAPRGPNIFCFETVSYPPPPPPPPDWESEFNIFDFLEPDDIEELFLSHPIPPPPPGWVSFRRGRQSEDRRR